MAQELYKTPHSRAGAHGPDRRTQTLAAVLLAEDGWHDERIAAFLGVSRRTLARWKTRPDMRLALDALYLLQCRKLHRRHSTYAYWPAADGPQSPDAWEGNPTQEPGA
jgi:hypothetical protein